ncbi:MAG: thiamine-phosphate kinase [Woeseiaceae bacterium]
MDEFDLIQKYFVRQGEVPGVSTGIGDDGAVMQPDPGRELIAVMDTLVQGVHFPDATDPFDIAYRAVAVNLSDVAAMGGRPRWMTLALTLPSADTDWLARFAEGLHAAASEFDVTLVGGDTTTGKSLVVTIQIVADAELGTAMKRSTANVGDAIYVTGTVGDAAAGLELISAGKPHPELSSRFLRPNARVSYGQKLTGVASAAIDVSDGMFADLSKLLAASNVGGVLQLESLPLSKPLQQQFDTAAQRRLALSGGDDYELVFTAAPDVALPDSDLRITRVGTVVAGSALVCHLDGELVPYSDSGYRHFE